MLYTRLSTLFALFALVFVSACVNEQPDAVTDEMPETETEMTAATDADLATADLQSTLTDFREMIAGLTPEQLAYRESPERWSIAENAEHLLLVEDGLRPNLTVQPGVMSKTDSAATDEMIVAVYSDRANPIPAAEPFEPQGQFEGATADEIIADFEASRTATIDAAESIDGDPRMIVSEHPAFGPIDAVQWMLTLSTHTERHLAQMQQVKDHSGYPTQTM